MRRVPAFALLEVALALIILGLVTSCIVPLIHSYILFEAQRKTELHLQHIISSLANYVLRHHRLPCPGHLDKDKGIAQSSCPQGVGLVPFKTLGLSEQIAKDGRHRWFTYVVNPELTSIAIQSLDQRDAKSFCHTHNHLLSVEDVDVPDHDCLAFVLTTHPPSNISLQVKASLQEVIVWISRDNLMALYAKRPCQPTSTFSATRPPSIMQRPPFHFFKKEEVSPKDN